MKTDGAMASPRPRSPAQQLPSTPKEVRVDMGSLAVAASIGRIKAPPMCLDETLKRESMTAEQISGHCFSLQTPKVTTTPPFAVDGEVPEASAVSSASSTASHSSAFSSDSECVMGAASGKSLTPSKLVRKQSEQINQKVISRKISRNGRLGQRWLTEPGAQKIVRLVTGCVPIVEGGKILFVSASRKPEWILPKGGWEQDEAMEESAIRETFEEAGVLGVLGPRLTGITYETRKAKKRRLEIEELQKKAKLAREMFSASPKSDKAITKIIPPPSNHNLASDAVSDNFSVATPEAPIETPVGPGIIPAPAQMSDEDFARIRGISARQSDETSSIASDASHTYTHVRMHLFPLYVSEVRSSWPESGRFRKIVDIDEAIRMCESRPEFKAVLQEIKAKNLHVLSAEDRTPLDVVESSS